MSGVSAHTTDKSDNETYALMTQQTQNIKHEQRYNKTVNTSSYAVCL